MGEAFAEQLMSASCEAQTWDLPQLAKAEAPNADLPGLLGSERCVEARRGKGGEFMGPATR